MTINRRQLLTSAASAAVCQARGGVAFAGRREGPESVPHPTLGEALKAAGFDPKRPDAFTAVFTSDVHYGAGDPAKMPKLKRCTSKRAKRMS